MRRESYPNRSNPPDRTGPAARGYRSAALRILKPDCSPARRYSLRVSGRFRSRLEMRLSASRGTGPFPTRGFYVWPGGGMGRASWKVWVWQYVVTLEGDVSLKTKKKSNTKIKWTKYDICVI